jgi:methionyl-tRNA formyltransferase
MKLFKFIFMGTPDVAAETLQVLFDNGYVPMLIVTGPDRASGRGMKIIQSDVKIWADAHNIETIQPEKITPEVIEKIELLQPELSIVVAYGKILPEKLISLPKYGTLNIHYSLLPRWRGATPVESVILHSDTITGVTIQSMVHKLDAGDVMTKSETLVDPHETTPELRARLSILGSDLLVKTLDNLESNLANKTVQDETLATHCGKMKKEDGHVMRDDNPNELYRKWRAYQPWPGIYYFDENGKRIKITEMKMVNNTPKITKIIPEGEREQIIG